MYIDGIIGSSPSIQSKLILCFVAAGSAKRALPVHTDSQQAVPLSKALNLQ